MKCRHCSHELTITMIDLGSSPPSNHYLTEESLRVGELWYPLRVLVCDQCWLAQAEDFSRADELFSKDYAYFSSYSKSWLDHSKNYVESVVDLFELGHESFVVELASNDGYLLQYVKEKGIKCLGIEPTSSTARVAREKGIEVIEAFFGKVLAEKIVKVTGKADLIIANNVLAHVPDINDFLKGCHGLLKDSGVATFEFPHLLKLVEESQFDTIYHEHFSYLSLTSVHKIFDSIGLEVFNVEEIPTHGGSLRIYSQKKNEGCHPISLEIGALLAKEEKIGLRTKEFYSHLQGRAETIKNNLIEFLIEAKKAGKKVGAYGAAAKGNTLLNYAGIKPDLLSWVVDLNPSKQGKFLPGSRIPILNESKIKLEKPDFILILPWNLKNEVISQVNYIKNWGGKFLTAIPELKEYEP